MNIKMIGATTLMGLALLGCKPPTGGSLSLPEGFVNLRDIDPDIQLDIRYYTSNNFIGRPIAGYFAPLCILTSEAAAALASAQQQAISHGYSLKVYDCYRPQQAVTDFANWAVDPDDILVQHRFYPQIDKGDLFELGYIANRSGHSRGSTVDLTLVPIESRQPAIDPFANRYDCRAAMPRRYPDNSIDMGTGYDCFDQLANTDNPTISESARANRELLRTIMEAAGFDNFAMEWWHYTWRNEPFPDSYFDFVIRLSN